MTESPKEVGDVTRQGRYNGVVVVVLILVGLVGAWLMFNELYPPAPPVPSRVPPPSEAAPTSVAPAAGAPAMPSATGHHALLAGPFSEAATAEELRAKLEKLGIPARVRVEAHLQVGPFGTPEEQDAARARLKELGVFGAQAITLKP